MNSKPYLPVIGSIIGGGAKASTKAIEVSDSMNMFDGIDAQFITNVVVAAALGALIGFICNKIFVSVWDYLFKK